MSWKLGPAGSTEPDSGCRAEKEEDGTAGLGAREGVGWAEKEANDGCDGRGVCRPVNSEIRASKSTEAGC